MKKNKRDLLFSTLSVLMIALFMLAEMASGLAVYANPPSDDGSAGTAVVAFEIVEKEETMKKDDSLAGAIFLS